MLKRAFDIFFSLFGLIVFSPLLLLIALWIRIDSPGPVFYRGARVGRNGKIFRIFKFRSMVVNAEQIGGSSTGDQDRRITKSGKFIRKFKLDELSQFLNVLVGDMSFVGPRPEVKQYTDMYNEEEQQILTVRPGITDWASIWNSDEGSILAMYDDPDLAYEQIIRPTKLRLQLRYVRTHNVWMDLKIIVYTLMRIIKPSFYPRELADTPRLTVPAERISLKSVEA